ncbi:MAG: HAD-IA family hydrolase [Deltaproteobacteria bacterium]|nr:HAD-IA family hydrolase [Deltaproteobacteria bacterium]MBW2446730.1 HAD-IA family hydrolase [Deltaproteobacteria bacterium]
MQLLLDVAGTLLERRGLHRTITEVLHRGGQVVSEAGVAEAHVALSERTDIPARPTRAFYEQFNASLLRDLGLDPRTDLIDEIYVACRELTWQPYPDVTALGGLNIPMGIVSNWDDGLEQVLAETIPSLRFDPIIASGAAGVAKPDPEIFEFALRSVGGSRDGVLYVGDSPRLDIEPATRAGLRAVLIDRELRYGEFAGETIRSFEELEGLLRR